MVVQGSQKTSLHFPGGSQLENQLASLSADAL